MSFSILLQEHTGHRTETIDSNNKVCITNKAMCEHNKDMRQLRLHEIPTSGLWERILDWTYKEIIGIMSLKPWTGRWSEIKVYRPTFDSDLHHIFHRFPLYSNGIMGIYFSASYSHVKLHSRISSLLSVMLLWLTEPTTGAKQPKNKLLQMNAHPR